MNTTNSSIDVLHVTEACGGGVRRHLRLIIPELVKNGVRCAIIGFGQRIEEEFMEDLEFYRSLGCICELWPFNHGNFLGTMNVIGKLKAFMKANSPAIVHAHSSYAGYACRRAKKHFPDIRLVYSPHAFAFHSSLPWYVRAATWISEYLCEKYTDAYVFVGRSEIQDANMMSLPPEKFHLIENGMPPTFTETLYPRQDARRALQIPQDQLVAAVPCRLTRQKGLDQLIRTIPMLGTECENVHFMFCGDGPEKEYLQSLAKECGVSDRVSFPNSIERLSYKLAAFDLAILPSLYEGLSYVLLECLAAGIPLVVSDILANVPRPEVREFLQTFAVGDLTDLAEKLRLCIVNRKWALAHAKDGAEYMHTNFTLNTQIKKLQILYKAL